MYGKQTIQRFILYEADCRGIQGGEKKTVYVIYYFKKGS